MTYSQETIDKAVDIMKNGGVVVYPTETSYGIGVDATNHEAVDKVYKIKKRSEAVTVPVVVADVKMAESLVNISETAHEYIDKYWPGPLTLVLPTKKGISISPHLIAPDGTLALRVPGYELARKLSAGLGKPITTTSANISNKPSCYTIEAVKRQLGEDVIDMYIDGGELPMIPSSTILRVVGSETKVLRQGNVKI